MRAIKLPGATRTMAAPSDWSDQIPAEELDIIDIEGFMVSTWAPTDEEREQIAAGANVNLWIHGQRFHPIVGMSVGQEYGK